MLGVSVKLGLTSFGGPVTHLGYPRQEYVKRRRWVDETTYAVLLAICQFLPGPASSQVCNAIGTLRVGILGALAVWIGFTSSSAIALVIFADGVQMIGPESAGRLHGLKVVAVVMVALAVWGIARSLMPDRE